MFNFEQLKGILERVLTIGVAWAVGKGLVPEALQGDLINLALLIASVGFGWFVNRSSALAVAAAKTA